MHVREMELITKERTHLAFKANCALADTRRLHNIARLRGQATHSPFADICWRLERTRVGRLDKPGAVSHSILSGSRATYGSLMILTTNSFVASMFSRVSFGFRGESVNETEMSGGSCEIYMAVSC